MSDVHERLRRLLFLVPYVSKHPGIGVGDLAEELGVSREALLEDLDLLTMVGRPPFQPDDYIEIYVENGKVYVDLDQRLSAPPRLTAAEGAALWAAAEFLRPAASLSLESAVKKLERILPRSARDRFREMGQKIDASTEAPADLAVLARSIVEKREVEFDYFSQSRGVTEKRTAHPRELFSHRGQWYLEAFCTARKDTRLFRLDRMTNLTVTDRPFTPVTAEGQAQGGRPKEAGKVRVRFAKEVAPYMVERFGREARALEDGGVEVFVSGESELWLVQWVLSFGGDAEVVEPEWARKAVAEVARALLEPASAVSVRPRRARSSR